MTVQEMFREIKKRICEFVHERNGSKALCKNQIESCLQLIRLCDVVRIMNQVESEYETKTDWIPCEERSPELDEGNEYFKQSKCVLVALEWWDGEITEEVGWYNEGGSWNHDAENRKVIAWQPLPQPYKKEGETDD